MTPSLSLDKRNGKYQGPGVRISLPGLPRGYSIHISLIHLTINGEKINTTPTHPFYIAHKGWYAAVSLRAGDILVLLNGEYVTLEKIQHEILEAPVKVYNFEVEDYHTYFVGYDGVLVHNDCRPRSPQKISESYIAQNNIDAHAFKRHAGVSRKKLSLFDIYKDKADNGRLWVGSKDYRKWFPTKYYFKDLISWKKK